MKKRGKKVVFNICDCENEMGQNNKEKYIPKTWDSLTKFYGNTDTTEVWNSENQIVSVHKGKYKKNLPENDFNHYDDSNEKTKYKTGRRKNHAQHSKDHRISNDVGHKRNLAAEIPDQKPHGTSVVSLFRYNNNKNRRSADLRNNNKTRLSTITATKQNCSEGPCEEAAKNNKIFSCKCVNRKREPEIVTKDCTDDTCKVLKNASSINSIVKFKDRFLCICRKYSQKIVNLKPRATCEDGICREAETHHKYDFNCKCDKNRTNNECTDKTCGEYTKVKISGMDSENGDKASSKRKLSLRDISSKLGLLQNVFKQRKKSEDIMIKLENVSEQTGEPFFEVQVNPRDMCVLNPLEIRENILKYGKPGWNERKCICPSRGRLKRGEVCSSGVCRKAYKNKQTNFKCWCDRRPTECGDTTCGIQNIKQTRKKIKNSKQINPRVNKPLLEVKLDRDKMCVVNPREIKEKVLNSMTVDDVCFSGVCRSNAKDGAPHHCTCTGRKMMSYVTECSEDTCTGLDEKKKWNKSQKWSFRYRSRNQKRPRRSSVYEIGPNKLCRGKICSKSDNLHRRNGLDLGGQDVKHLPTCNCEECNLNKKRLPPPRENNLIKEENTINNNKNITQTKRLDNYKDLDENNVDTKEHKTIATNITCTCAHSCECHLDQEIFKTKDKLERKRLAKKLRDKKRSQRLSAKEMKRRAKLDRKKEKKAAKERLREIRAMQKKMKEEPLDANFCTAFLLGLLKIAVKTALFIFSIIVAIVTDPKGSFWYIRDRIRDHKGTFNKLSKWFSDALMIKKLQISETIRGSDTLTILADHFLDTPFYQSFADKGKTKKEQMQFEQKSKARKRRIRKREQQAIYSCRHNLLTTLRKTPCLWVYHICPNFYPQCLGLLAFMRNFSHILMFLIAFMCWTPCILSFELCRAMLCCFMCTN